VTGSPEPPASGAGPAGGGAPDGERSDDAGGRVEEHDVQGLVARLEHLLRDSGAHAVQSIGHGAVPAWKRVTEGEPRVPASVAIVAAVGLMVILPSRVAIHPMWVLPVIALPLLVAVIIVNTRRVDGRARALRAMSLSLIALLSLANAVSGIRLVVDLARAEGIKNPTTLLLTGAAIWLTNVIVFSLWYWEFDRGGPIARGLGTDPYPDFLFPQMTSPELSPPDWEPQFVDYLYVSFTNATAFSPTDVMPMSRWTKLTMLGQATISVVTVALVIARAVNVLH
jgi:uncharacterized membrane protein